MSFRKTSGVLMHERNSWFIENGEACLRPKPSPSMRAMCHIELSWLSLVTMFLNSPVEKYFDGLALGVNPPGQFPCLQHQIGQVIHIYDWKDCVHTAYKYLSKNNYQPTLVYSSRYLICKLGSNSAPKYIYYTTYASPHLPLNQPTLQH